MSIKDKVLFAKIESAVKSLSALVEKHLGADGHVELTDNSIIVEVPDTDKGKQFGKVLLNNFRLGDNSFLTDDVKQELVTDYPVTTNSFVNLQKEGRNVLKITLVKDSEFVVSVKQSFSGVSNIERFTVLYQTSNTEFLTDCMGLRSVYPNTIKMLEELRLKTLNVTDVINDLKNEIGLKIRKLSLTTENGVEKNKEYIYWKLLLDKLIVEKTEFQTYLFYLVLTDIQKGQSLNKAKEHALTISMYDLKKITDFYGLSKDLREVAIDVIQTKNLPDVVAKEIVHNFPVVEDEGLTLNIEQDNQEIERTQIINRLRQLIETELNIPVLEQTASELLGGKYRTLNSFNTKGIPEILETIGQNKQAIEQNVRNYMTINFGLFRISPNMYKDFVKTKKMFTVLTESEIQDVLFGTIKEKTISKMYKLVDKFSVNYLVEQSSKQEVYETFKNRIESEQPEALLERYTDYLSKVSVLRNQKLLTGAEEQALEKIFTYKLNVQMRKLIADKDVDGILNAYKIIFKGDA